MFQNTQIATAPERISPSRSSQTSFPPESNHVRRGGWQRDIAEPGQFGEPGTKVAFEGSMNFLQSSSLIKFIFVS